MAMVAEMFITSQDDEVLCGRGDASYHRGYTAWGLHAPCRVPEMAMVAEYRFCRDLPGARVDEEFAACLCASLMQDVLVTPTPYGGALWRMG